MNNKSEFFSVGKVVVPLCTTMMVAGLLFLPGSANAQNITLSDGGSTATINPGLVNGGSGTLGMDSWSVLSGQNQLNQQWFWYSVNGSTAASIDAIGGYNPTLNAPNDATLTYANSQLSVSIEYVLSGNGVSSGSADLQEYISVVNEGGSQINLNFYQYSNFNLLGQPNTVSISGGPGAYTGATQTTGGAGGSGLAEVIDVPYANYAEAALAGVTLSELGAAPYTLNDNTSTGPGDVSWAFEWNATLAPYGQSGDMLDITKDKGLSIQIVPEPSTFAMIVLGAAALGLARRRQSS